MSQLKRIYGAMLVFAMAFSIAAYADNGAGKFDYYLLSLSWSPEYCSVKREPTPSQCEKQYGFVVHGLWPQNIKGYPQFCSEKNSEVPAGIVQQMLPVMPSATLIQHEWEKHGTCSGKDAAAYFGLVNSSFAAIHIPPDLEKPDHQISMTVDDIRKKFAAANHGIHLAVACKGKFLQEVRICLNKDGNAFVECGEEVKDNCPKSVVVRPLK